VTLTRIFHEKCGLGYNRVNLRGFEGQRMVKKSEEIFLIR